MEIAQEGEITRAVSEPFPRQTVEAQLLVVAVNEQPEGDRTRTCCAGIHPWGAW